MREFLLALKNSSNAFSTSNRELKRELGEDYYHRKAATKLFPTHRRKLSKSIQKSGDEMTFWYGVNGAWTGGRISPSSRLSATSTGVPPCNGTREFGEGDKITEGTLRWRSVGLVAPGSSVAEVGSSTGLPGASAGISTLGESRFWLTGLTIRLTVSPSLILYSFSSFASARALPLRSKRCASTGGAPDCEAR